MAPFNRIAALFAFPALAATLTLTGCSGLQPAGTSAVAGVSLSGKILGGQPPVTGSHVYLYAAGTSGYGSASISTLNTSGPGVTTDGSGNGYVTVNSSGSWSISGDYTCPTATSQMYLLATGGNPGLASGTNNNAITLITAIGNCSTLQPTTNITISELSTVAAVTALQQFMVDTTHIGTTSTNVAGLAAAFGAVPDMVALSATNANPTPAAASGVVPQREINSIANVLAPCINSASNASTPCTNLFNAATPAAGTTPTEVAGAMLLIAKNPGRNIATLFGLIDGQAPFQPSLTSAPNDFSIGVTYTGGGLANPGIVVIDAVGDAYTANCPSCNGAAGTDSIVGFGPQGAVLTGATGYTTNIHMVQGLAFDNAGFLWSVNDAGGTFGDQIVKMSASTGAVATGFPYGGSSLGAPIGIAIDSQNYAWVTNRNLNNAVKINSSGVFASQTYSSQSNGLMYPTGVGIDGTGIVYAAGTGSNSIYKFDGNGNNLTGGTSGYTGAGLSQPVGIAIDHSSNIWTVDNGTNAISEINGTNGAAVSPSTGYTPSNGIYQAAVIAIDGAGTAWISNCRIGCPTSGSTGPDNILHLTTAGVNVNMSDGLQNAQFKTVGTVAIDASGNVWVTNNQGGSLTKLVGVAVPVKTPLAVASAANQLGVKP